MVCHIRFDYRLLLSAICNIRYEYSLNLSPRIHSRKKRRERGQMVSPTIDLRQQMYWRRLKRYPVAVGVAVALLTCQIVFQTPLTWSSSFIQKNLFSLRKCFWVMLFRHFGQPPTSNHCCWCSSWSNRISLLCSWSCITATSKCSGSASLWHWNHGVCGKFPSFGPTTERCVNIPRQTLYFV